jgi:hypothetical protein
MGSGSHRPDGSTRPTSPNNPLNGSTSLDLRLNPNSYTTSSPYYIRLPWLLASLPCPCFPKVYMVKKNNFGEKKLSLFLSRSLGPQVEPKLTSIPILA